MRALICSLAAVVCAAAVACTTPTSVRTPPANPARLETIADDTLSLGIDVNRGGAIVSLELRDGGPPTGNLVDNGDLTGRSIQASLYDGHWGPDSWPCNNATQVWGWNPVQEGDACQTLSGGHVDAFAPMALRVSTTPRQWNSLRGLSRVALTEVLTLPAAGVVKIDYILTNHEAFTIGSDNWHELPVAYLNSALTIGTTSAGQQTRVSMPGFRDGSDWVALSRADDVTVALYAPGQHLWSIGFGGGDKPTSFLQAWQWLELAPEQTGTSTAWLIVGRSLDQVRGRIATLTGGGL